MEISSEAGARASKLVVFCGTIFVRKREINKAGHNHKSRIKLFYSLQTEIQIFCISRMDLCYTLDTPLPQCVHNINLSELSIG
jgi:hypothetical protein